MQQQWLKQKKGNRDLSKSIHTYVWRPQIDINGNTSTLSSCKAQFMLMVIDLTQQFTRQIYLKITKCMDDDLIISQSVWSLSVPFNAFNNLKYIYI